MASAAQHKVATAQNAPEEELPQYGQHMREREREREREPNLAAELRSASECMPVARERGRGPRSASRIGQRHLLVTACS